MNNSITSVTDGEGRRIDYQYNPNKNIVQITENPLDEANKSITTVDYDNNNNLVKITDANSNADPNSSLAYIYTYDEKGNVTGVQLPEGQNSSIAYDTNNNPIEETDFNGNESSSTFDKDNNELASIDPYLQSTASRYSDNGNMEYDTKTISAADNLVSNSSLENGTSWPESWTQAVESGKTATFNWSDTAKFGNKSISISNPTGWAIVSSDMIDYVEGNNYVVSGYVKTENTTSTAVIKVEFFDSNNGWIGQKIDYGLKGTHDWTRVHSVIDEIPAGTAKIRTSVGFNAGTGTVYFDGIQMEKGNVVSNYNFVENGGFETDTDSNNIPDNWTTSGNLSANDGIYTKMSSEDDNVYSDKNSFKINGESGKNKYIKQTLNISGDVNTKFTLSGWSKQEGIDPNGGNYLLQVKINHTDGTVDWLNANDFDKSVEDWQHIAAEINPEKAFDSIEVYYYYYNQKGIAYFDSMRLEEGSSFTSYYYDSNNYTNKIVDPLGNQASFIYDSYGNKTRVIDGKGNNTSYEYDNTNILKKVTDAKLNNTLYGYDSVGNRTTVTDARNKVTTYSYNEFNQISSITNPLNQTIQFGYDKNGNTTKVLSPKGDEVSYTYNALNRLNEVYYNGVKKWNYEYDANGNITSVTESATGKNKNYIYDKNDRMTRLEEGTSNSTDYVYDDNSNLTSRKITAGSTTIDNGYNYNKLNQVIGISREGSSLEKFTYDEQGNVISIIRSNGTYSSFKYDEANRLTKVTNYNASGESEDYYEYIYDKNGNRTSVITKDGAISYQYDELNQLLEEKLLDGTTISYEYDTVGNRTKKIVTNGNSTTTTYTYNDGNELTAVDGQAYTYDQNGNLTNNGDKTFIYNEENRLIEVKDSSNQTIAKFTYDHEGKRNSITKSTGTINFHYEGNNVIYETDESDNITAEYTYDVQGNPATMIKNDETYYYHVNGHGDVMSLTDISGNIVAEYSYDAWGNIISQIGSMASENPYRYAGYRYDESTELYYLMARYYDSEIGRFITRDTFHGFEDDPQSLNQYAYTGNNPVKYSDPSGYYRKNGWWNSTKWVGRIIDALIIAFTAGQTIYGQYAAKKFLRKNKTKVVYRIRGKIMAMFGSSRRTAIFAAISIGLTLVGATPGQIIAKGLDYIDHWWGHRRNNGYIMG